MSDVSNFLADTNQSFDLPRWQTQIDPSSAQAAHSAQPAQPSYLSSAPQPPVPPPPSAASQRLQPPTTSSRQPRISQLLDQDQHIPILNSSYLSSGQSQLARSASLGGAPTNNMPASKPRRHHQQDDLEGAFNIEHQSNQPLSGSGPFTQLSHNSFYPPSVGYQQQSLTGTGAAVSSAASPSDSYSEIFYNGSASQPSKRSQAPHDPISSARTGRSPMRASNPPTSATLIDSYSQQSQYSPTTATYSYAPADQRTHTATYNSHSRNHSQVKSESMTPPISSPYTPQSAALGSAGPYSPSYPMDTSSPRPPSHIQTHLAAHVPSRHNSTSNPPTPLSYLHSQSPSLQYYSQDQAMVVDAPPPKRRASGFRRVRTAHDLQPRTDIPPTGRRMASDGVYLSPLRQLTTNLLETFHICNPQFRYESTHNPRRVLTKPSKPAHNEGYDNDDYDYILYVNDWLGTEEGHKYLILDILGQGTFGQVVKCQNMKTHEIVAVKVVKNKPAYFNQSMMEVTILEMLNKTCDPNDEHHILRLRDSFIHRSHLCLVFELLSSNLYELIKQNQFQGLSTQLVKVFMAQLLDALTVLKDARLIHCDLKPENILLKSLQSPQIKVIDFGSACHERQTVYTYIQSRFYRSPEVLLGMSYTAAIDMWSLGCIAVELFLGLPLFPGTSEYNQLTRIIEMLGLPPMSMLNTGKQTSQFFDTFDVWNPHASQNEKKYRLKSLEQYSREHNTNEQPGKQYFKATSLPDIINTAPMPTSKSSRQGHEVEKELNNRASFVDFCQGLLNLNPVTRWTPQQARLHPFITGEKWTKPFVPDGIVVTHQGTAAVGDPKRPYGGLVPSQPKGTRAYQDAATYNHHLAQHQAYTAQAQAASQAATAFRNPYITPQNPQPPPPPQVQTTSYASESANSTAAYPQHNQYPTNHAGHRLAHQASSGQLEGLGNTAAQYQGHAQGASSNTHLNPNVPASSYYPNTRVRANTINQMKDVPAALARLQRMDNNMSRNALTPVLNRDDAMQEWERRQSGKPSAVQSYPQIEYLQQQAEMAAASGSMSWGHAKNRYPPPPSSLSHTYHPPPIMVDDDNARREVVMSNVRSAARNEGAGGMYASAGTGVISNPPPTYASNATTSGNRYTSTFPPAQQQATLSSFDPVDRRTDMGNMYLPMQSEQFSSYNSNTSIPANRLVAAPAQTAAPPFYGAAVVATGQSSSGQQQQQRNPFSVPDSLQSMAGTKDGRRGGNMDAWPR